MSNIEVYFLVDKINYYQSSLQDIVAENFKNVVRSTKMLEVNILKFYSDQIRTEKSKTRREYNFLYFRLNRTIVKNPIFKSVLDDIQIGETWKRNCGSFFY